MKLIADLAMRDLFREKIHLICNTAVLAGVIVPLLVLLGVKNGVYDALIGRLLSDPATLRIDTAGNAAFSEADAAEVRAWAEVGYVTPKTRSMFDLVNVRPEGVRTRRDAVLVPSGTGDPTLGGIALAQGQAAISSNLARQLEVTEGDTIEIITQAEDRPRQLLLKLAVSTVLPDGRMAGRAVLTDIQTLDLVEAFYDEYALPEHGITAGRPLESRNAQFEGLRVFSRDLETLAALQSKIEERFGIDTVARTAEVTSVLGLGRNLNLALILTAVVASIGLAAALVFGFWGEVARKRRMMAVLALMGVGGNRLWLFPVLQALVSGAIGLGVSLILFVIASFAAEQLFESGLTDDRGLVFLKGPQLALIVTGTLAFVLCSALFAARSAMRVDPADVLREGAT